MVLILDGNSLRGAHLRRNIYYSTCLRHLIVSRAVTNRIFLSEKTFISLSPSSSNISIMQKGVIQISYFGGRVLLFRVHT